jgi:glycosyltransferase involved in cell wall biosynthesis
VPRDGRLRILELRSVRGTGGGPEKTILLGAAKADRAIFDVTVSYIRDRRDSVFALDRRAAELGLEYREIVERHSFDPGIWPQLREVVRDRRIDIVHAHEYKTDAIAFLLARRLGVLPLATVHGWSGFSPREKWIYYPADKRLLARYPRLIAVSTPIKDELVRHGANPDHVTVILNAVDSTAFSHRPDTRAAVRRSLELDAGHFLIGAIGRLEREKRFDLLVRAFGEIARRHEHARLAIVGEGSWRAQLEALIAELGLGDRCRLLGLRHDVLDLYQAFDVLVQSSETEGTSNVILEGMATEVPIVATDVGGTRELIRHDVEGLIVPRLDAPALARAIAGVLAGPAAAKDRAARARRRVEAELSFEARTRKLEGVYLDLARAHGRL